MTQHFHRLITIILEFLERISLKITSPFRMDKLLLVSGLGMIASPSVLNISGTLKFETKYLDLYSVFGNNIDTASYLVGSILVLCGMYSNKQDRVTKFDISRVDDLVNHLNSADSYINIKIQSVFFEIFKYHTEVSAIRYLLSFDDPYLSVWYHRKAHTILHFDGFFILNKDINLEKMIRKNSIFYYASGIFCIGLYILFCIALSNDKISSVVLGLMFIWSLTIAYTSLNSCFKAERAKLLLELQKPNK